MMCNYENAINLMRQNSLTTLSIIKAYDSGEVDREEYIAMIKSQNKWLEDELKRLK